MDPKEPGTATATSDAAPTQTKLQDFQSRMKTALGERGDPALDAWPDEAPAAEAAPEAPAPVVPEAPAHTAPQDIEAPSEDSPASPEPGLDALAAALDGKPAPTREQKIGGRDALEKRLLEAGESPYVAKLMAHQGSIKETEAHLTELADRATSPTASQGEPVADPVPAGATEERRALEALSESSGEETAAAVTETVEELVERRVREVLSQSDDKHEQRETLSEIRRVAGELEGDCPGLVRGEGIHPLVGEYASQLANTTGFKGDLPRVLRTAYGLAFPEKAGAPAPRQVHSSPDLEAPRASAHLEVTAPPSRSQNRRTLMELASKHRNDPAAATRAFADNVASVQAKRQRATRTR